MTRRGSLSLLFLFLLACYKRGIEDPKYLLAYHISQSRGHWIWNFDYCGSHRRHGSRILDVRIWHSGARGDPLCFTPIEKQRSNIWPHGEELLARDGSPCQLGAGRYHIVVSPDLGGAEFEIAPNGDMRVLGEQCFVPDDK